MDILLRLSVHIGLFGYSPGTGYPIYGPEELFGYYPRRDRGVDITTGVHWWAFGMARAFGSDTRPNALMSIPFLVISVLGAVVFFGADDNPVGALFVGLTLVYACAFFASLGSRFWERALGFVHIAVGAWLMYLTVAAALNFSRGFDLPL